MSMRTRTAAGATGFTLIELLIVVAIIAILFALVASRVADSRCEAGINTATGAINTCKSTISLWRGPDVQQILDCLKSAQEAIDELKKSDWWTKGKPAVEIGVREINQAVDELVTRVESETDKQKLRDAKLTVD